jgi:peroxiredoxin
MAKAVAASLALPYPLLHDPEGEVFARFGFEKRLYIIQQSGTVLVDRSGVIRYATRSANPGASLRLPELMRQVAAAGSAT